MLEGNYFYNGTLRKAIAVFGTIFNEMYIGKRLADGALVDVRRVPLSYAPRAKFIDRIRQDEAKDDTKLAVKLPRMAFEITNLSPDPAFKRAQIENRRFTSGGNPIVVRSAVPYKLGIQLNIYSRNLDDCLQIFEQIAPLFGPEYVVAVKEMEGPGSSTDIPISLVGLSIQDDYDGDLASTRRSVIYTLDFDMPIKFAKFDAYGDNRQFAKKYIKFVHAHLHADLRPSSDPVEAVHVHLGDMENDTPEDFTVVTEYGLLEDEP